MAEREGFVPEAARAAECLKTTRSARRSGAKFGGERGIRTLGRVPLHTLSKRAPSTTRPSLRLESITYESDKANCVRPPNAPRSLTGLSSIAAASLLDEVADRLNPAELIILETASKLASAAVC